MSYPDMDMHLELNVEKIEELREAWRPKHTHIYCHNPGDAPKLGTHLGTVVAAYVWDRASVETVRAWAAQVKGRLGADLMCMVMACSSSLCPQMLQMDTAIWMITTPGDRQ